MKESDMELNGKAQQQCEDKEEGMTGRNDKQRTPEADVVAEVVEQAFEDGVALERWIVDASRDPEFGLVDNVEVGTVLAHMPVGARGPTERQLAPTLSETQALAEALVAGAGDAGIESDGLQEDLADLVWWTKKVRADQVLLGLVLDGTVVVQMSWGEPQFALADRGRQAERDGDPAPSRG